MSPQTFGAFVRQCREGREFTLLQVSSWTGLSKGYLSEIENGQHNPSLDVALKLARVLRFSLDKFGDLDDHDAFMQHHLTDLQFELSMAQSYVAIAMRHSHALCALMGIVVDPEAVPGWIAAHVEAR